MAHIRLRTVTFAALSSVLLMAAATAAHADNDKTPPGDPCGDGPGQGTGNPCNGNNGNEGEQGNAGSGGTGGFEPIALPDAEERGVFITQVGQTNRAEVRQASGNSYARTAQTGAENAIVLVQGASGRHYASVAQDGDNNTLDGGQDGSGQNVLLLAQQGDGNGAIIRQNDNGSSYTAAAVLQSGNGNEILLVQDGSDNQARLTQDGDDNTMTATQLNSGNRLEWSQTGDGLADLGVVQEGNGSLQITQSITGAQFVPAPGSGG
jgi:hypothetical protein